MRYLGGKSRLGKRIASVVLQLAEGDEAYYIEPFVGSAGVAEKIVSLGFNGDLILADASPDLIHLYHKLQMGWEPPDEVSEREYERWRGEKPSAMRGFVGYGCSWGGKFFGGYARGEGRNYAGESKRALLKTINALSHAKFVLSDYKELTLPKERSIIYNDPPYKGTTSYEATGGFDTGTFWNWVREASKDHLVLTSEYQAPEDFEVVWSKDHTTSIRPKGGNEKRAEGLFRWKGTTTRTANQS